MSVYRFQCIIPTDTAIPADFVTNTWHWNSTAGGADMDNVRDMLADFYTATPTGGSFSIASRMSNLLNGPVQVKAYALEDPEPRVPVYESTFSATFASSAPLPSECALCLSYQADRVSGSSQARRRGRIYLGPWAQTAISSGDGTPAIRTLVAQAARDLVAASDAAVSWEWVVWSPTDQQDHVVTNGWVDNAWDTQRRRGPAPTARTTWTDATP